MLFSSCKWYVIPVLALEWALRVEMEEGLGERCGCVPVCLTAKPPQFVMLVTSWELNFPCSSPQRGVLFFVFFFFLTIYRTYLKILNPQALMAWELLSGHVLCLWNHPLWLASRPLSPSWTASGGHPLEADPPREVLQWFSGPKEYTSLFWLLIKMSFFTKRFWQTFEGADLGVGYVFVYFCFSIYLFAHNTVVRSVLLLQGSCLQCIIEATT